MPKNKSYRYQTFDDDYYKFAPVHERASTYNKTEDTGFEGYEATTVDPGRWVLVVTTIFCFGVMLLIVPLLVKQKFKRRRKKKKRRRKEISGMDLEPLAAAEDGEAAAAAAAAAASPSNKKKKQLMTTILAWDDETKKILSLAIPYTISGLSSATMSNICLGLIGNYVGTRAVAAYALVQILLALTDGVLYGPISACTTVCAHAVGASNPNLAGQYIQIAIGIYLLSSIPVVWFWWLFMEDVILFIEWGDEETAALAQDFTRVYIWTYVLGGISTSLWQLLEVAGHVVEGTVVSIIWGVVNVIVISAMVFGRGEKNTTLFEVGVAYVITSTFFVAVTYLYADYKGWLKPFKSGLFGTNALFKNHDALKVLMKQGIPLGLGYILANAEWTILTFFASYLGPAEVAAWAILASIWDVFYQVTTGISDAGEMRVAHYFGQDKPEMARLAAYKALLLSMSVASVVSVIFFSLQNSIPTWFTMDETLQGMLREVVPFVGVGNLTMQFGMTSWSLIGAQGKYKLATWVSAVSDWAITVPMSALFCFVLAYDLKGLTAAVVIGYVCTGAALSYVLLGTNWEKVATKIREANAATTTTATTEAANENDNNNNDDNDAEEQNDAEENATYAALRAGESEAARTVATGNVRLVVLPAGVSSGLVVQRDEISGKCLVLVVKPWSPLIHQVVPGDVLMSLDGRSVSEVTDVSDMLKDPTEQDRQLVVVSPAGTDAAFSAVLSPVLSLACSCDAGQHNDQRWDLEGDNNDSGSTDDESRDGEDDHPDNVETDDEGDYTLNVIW